MNKKILVTGATGMLGKSIVSRLCSKGAFVRILTTDKKKARSVFEKQYTVQPFEWKNFDDPISLTEIIEDSDAIINLAGANVGNKRWTKEYMKEIYSSRIEVTKLLVNSIKLCKKKPECLINASAVGYYGFTGNSILTEDSGPGDDFLAMLCRDWEAEAMKAVQLSVRVAIIRGGIVLGKNEGALKELLGPFKFSVGVYQGNGNQWMSWIHINDITDAYLFALENPYLRGAVNACSPEPVTNKQMITTIAKVLNKKIILPVPGFILKIVVGKFAENLLTGQKVYPKKLIEESFIFRYPELKEALKNLLSKQ